MSLAEKIITLRKKQGMSQEQLAEKLNVSRQTISRWENGTVAPDAFNVVEISKVFGVTSDYLLNDDFKTDDDIPQLKKAKKENRVLQLNLSMIAILLQTASVNIAFQPFSGTEERTILIDLVFKIALVLATSIWMAFNLRFEKDPKQYRKNTLIELGYCGIEAIAFMIGYYMRPYLGTALLFIAACFYLLVINPKYMNRPYGKKKDS